MKRSEIGVFSAELHTKTIIVEVVHWQIRSQIMSDVMLQKAADLLRPVPDFPKQGILFWDIAPVLRDASVVAALVDCIVSRWEGKQIDVVVGFDARGFIFGALVAARLNVAFEQIRKKGKLPGKTQNLEYELEYGSGVQEMIDDGFLSGKRVLLVDDLLATGGTAWCGAKLVEALGGFIVGLSVVTELPELGGRGILAEYRVHSLITAVGDQKVIDAAYCVDMVVHDPKSGELVLIKRLSDPIGIALPGGHVEDESAFDAATRELFEEVGCVPSQIRYCHTLSQLDRDPRGVKISLVMSCVADSLHARGEPEKTEVMKVCSLRDVPKDSDFVLGHARVVWDIWKKR